VFASDYASSYLDQRQPNYVATQDPHSRHYHGDSLTQLLVVVRRYALWIFH